jgi:S1-C subfamily serine protease
MKPIVYLIFALALPHASHAQEDVPLLLPEERQAIDDQADAFNQAIRPALETAAKSTVRVWAGSRRLAYGTVVGNGSQILSKWSELANATEELRVDAGNEQRVVKIAGVYEKEDLAVLEIEGKPLTPVVWSFETPPIGGFIAAPQPDGKLAAFGIVSVAERNLRDTDLAFLGVVGELGFSEQGVKIKEVADGSGALAAGLKPGNIILKVGERTISGLFALKNALAGTTPGEKITLRVKADNDEKNVDVVLGNRPKPAEYPGTRIQIMERMGGPISQVRNSFTLALQTDMRPKPNQIGGPVVDLEGHIIGITMARADRTRSYVMPAAALVELLKKDADKPELVQVKEDETPASPGPERENAKQGHKAANPEARMRRHLSDMQRLMDLMRKEMRALEQP